MLFFALLQKKLNTMTTTKNNKYKVSKQITYEKGTIAIAENIKDFDSTQTLRTNGIVTILCRRGSMKLDINGQTCMANENDLVICMPEIIVEKADFSHDFEFKAIFMSVDYAFNMLPTAVRSWNFKMFFDQNPKVRLTAKEANIFNQYFELLKEKFTDTSNRYRDNVVNSLIEALVYEFRGVFDNYLRLKPHPISSAENIFNKFIEMLVSTYPKRRTVAHYADLLNITPKYLSVVCKKVGGRNSSKIIDAYVAKDIERLLKNSSKSVKEISVELDFPNTSFFGRYVKKNFGCTPNELRRRLNWAEE